MACIIADSGPLIAFAKIKQLSILHELFDRILIAASVQQECLVKSGADAEAIGQAIRDGWLVVNVSAKDQLVLSRSLGVGESDSIRLAMRNPQNNLD